MESVLKVCENERCKKQFLSTHWKQKYCSKECAFLCKSHNSKNAKEKKKEQAKAIETMAHYHSLLLDSLTPDELLHYGRTQTQRYLNKNK